MDRSRYIWIDALCINQYDINERSAQVRKLLNVYQKASKVVVWLGENSGIFDKYLDGMKSRRKWRSLTKRTDDLCEDHRRDVARDVHRNPWFYRSWVQQEIWAAEAIEVSYGPYTFPWENFNVIWSTLGITPKLQVDDPGARTSRGSDAIFLKPFKTLKLLAQRSDISWSDLQILKNEDIFRPGKGNSTELLYAMQRTASCQCSDERDRIYALLGTIIHNRPSSFNRGARVIFPAVDYSKSVTQVYCDVIEYYVTRTGSLLILLHLFNNLLAMPSVADGEMPFGGNVAGERLPSWCPNWTAYFNKTYLGAWSGVGAWSEGPGRPFSPEGLSQHRNMSKCISWPSWYIKAYEVGRVQVAEPFKYAVAGDKLMYRVGFRSDSPVGDSEDEETSSKALQPDVGQVCALTRPPRRNDLVVCNADLTTHFLVISELPDRGFELIGVSKTRSSLWHRMVRKMKKAGKLEKLEIR